MKKNVLLLLLPLLGLLAGTAPAHAQNTPIDTILRTDGTEVTGRVLSITPLELRYLPAVSPDTLHLAVADVFLVRYANGTHELLHPMATFAPTDPALTPDLLPGLTDAQRRAQGHRDADQYYNSHGPFWATLGSTLYAGPLLGLVAPAVIAPHAVSTNNLRAPHPELLADPAYDYAYRQQAQRTKRNRAWGGYGLGVGLWIVLIAALVSGVQ